LTEAEGQPEAVRPGDTIAVALLKMRRIIASGFADRAVDQDTALDARMLLLHGMKLSHAGLISMPSKAVSEPAAEALTRMATLRGAGTPVARLVGEAEFWSLPFYLSADTLVPRPDSELVVEAVLSCMRQEPAHILDVGTGTGCLPLAVLSERPLATALGVDVSQGALSVAQRNARRHGLDGRFSTAVSDVFDGLQKEQQFDVILSNPPYIATRVIDDLASDVRDHDPRLALDGGQDGLDIYRPLIADAAPFLRPGGHLVLEIGYDQELSVTALMEAAGYEVRLLRDLAGHPRVLIGHKSEPNR
jgi:release factor glutamine methyltransferase